MILNCPPPSKHILSSYNNLEKTKINNKKEKKRKRGCGGEKGEKNKTKKKIKKSKIKQFSTLLLDIFL
jgi:hypothetical protein